MPHRGFLERIRSLIPVDRDDRYREVESAFAKAQLTMPATPMSDQKLSEAIAGFLNEPKHDGAITALSRSLNPK